MNTLVTKSTPPTDLLIRAVCVVDPRTKINESCDVLIRDGQIAELGGANTLTAPPQCEVIEAKGWHLFPGFFDPHVHLRTPGQEHKEDIDSGTRAAAAGGYVGIIAMANTDPVVDSPEQIRALHELARREARLPVGFVAAVTRGLGGELLTDMTALRRAGAAGFSDDGKPIVNAGIMRKALQYQHLCGGVIALHEEDPALSGMGVMHEGTVSAGYGLAGIPAVSESTMIERDAAIAAYENGRIHIQHLSACESVRAVAEAKQRGVQITAEVSPHHLTLTHEALQARLDTSLKMNPPLRSADDRSALIAGLKDGTIDYIATDHAPHALEEKETVFELAPMGTTGLETAFSALYSKLVLPGLVSLDLLIEKLTAGSMFIDLPPARIAVGESADLCLVDLAAQWRVGDGGYESRSSNCCFSGQHLFGRVLLTVARGSTVYRERSFALAVA